MMKKANTAIYIPNMDADKFEKICNEKGLQFVYVSVPPHGRLIDADALKSKQQEDADLFIKSYSLTDKIRRDEALNAVANIVNAPTIIPAEEGEA